jgi:hypothetical protein
VRFVVGDGSGDRPLKVEEIADRHWGARSIDPLTITAVYKRTPIAVVVQTRDLKTQDRRRLVRHKRTDARRPEGRPFIASYVATIKPLPLSWPSSSRDPISISASPVEIA